DLRLLQQPLGGPLAGQRERDEAAPGPARPRPESALAAEGAVLSRDREPDLSSEPLATGAPESVLPESPEEALAVTHVDTAATPPTGPRRATVAFIFVTVLIDVLAIGLIIPVLPRLVQQFMGGDTARAASVYGIFVTVWALMQFFFSPILGSLSDRFGR